MSGPVTLAALPVSGPYGLRDHPAPWTGPLSGHSFGPPCAGSVGGSLSAARAIPNATPIRTPPDGDRDRRGGPAAEAIRTDPLPSRARERSAVSTGLGGGGVAREGISEENFPRPAAAKPTGREAPNGAMPAGASSFREPECLRSSDQVKPFPCVELRRGAILARPGPIKVFLSFRFASDSDPAWAPGDSAVGGPTFKPPSGPSAGLAPSGPSPRRRRPSAILPSPQRRRPA